MLEIFVGKIFLKAKIKFQDLGQFEKRMDKNQATPINTRLLGLPIIWLCPQEENNSIFDNPK